MRRTRRMQPRRQSTPWLLGGNSDFKPRRFLLVYVEKYLRKLQPSESLLSLAISSLDMRSKSNVLDLVKGLPTTVPRGPAVEDVTNSIADVYELQNYITCRLKGAAFDEWWKDFVRVV